MLEGIEVRLNVDYLENKEELDKLAEKVIYTGPIDAYLIISWYFWSIALSDLRMRFLISQTSKVTQL